MRFLVLATLALGCSTRHESKAPPPTSASGVIGLLRGHAEIARHLDPSATLVVDGTRLRLSSHRPGFVPAGAFGARVSAPRTSLGALRLESNVDAGRWVEIDDPSLRDVGGEVVEGAVVFRDAAPATDVVVALEPGRVEESRLRRVGGAFTSSWRLRKGPALGEVRLKEGRIEIVDRSGRVFVEGSPIVAWDARGRRFDPKVTLDAKGDEVFVRAAFDATDAALPLAIDPAWTTTANMKAQRHSPAAAALADGRVMVIGGTNGSFGLSTTEIFDPATSTWSDGPNTVYVHDGGHFAVRLNDGKVLVGGGGILGTETWNPATNTFTAVGNLTGYHSGSANGVALHPTSGKVYAAGSGGFSAGFDVYDPVAKTWTSLASMGTAREEPSITVLPGGAKILAAGSNSATSSAELYDIATNTWAYTPTTMPSVHFKPLTFVHAGLVHVVGALAAHSVYDPVANSWTAGSPLSVLREPGYVGGQFSSGRFFIDGGYNSAMDVEVWNPTSGAWQKGSVPATGGRFRAASAPLPSDRFLIAGGYGAAPLSTAEIFTLMANGQTCTLAADCASGLCVDGVCCNTACNTGACVACDLSTAKGTCSPVTSGAPHGTRSCGAYGTCTSGGACATTCGTTTDCAAGYYCSSTTCVARKANGTTCSGNEQCTSNFCVDGVCCNRACAGQCESCSRPASLGTCVIMTGTPAPDRAACTGTAPGTTCGHQCNGTNPGCVYPPATAACSGAGCTGGFETRASLCDGAGKCGDTPKSCGAYVCGTTACLSSCTTNAQCATGFYCSSNNCVPVADLGKECSAASACSTGNCVDGVCCASAACDGGSSCANPGNKGKCTKNQGTACAAATECGSGQCVDGVCCESACAGQCEACDVTGRLGKCFPVSGKPHGARAACDEGAGDTCKARTCDGAKDTTTCVGYAAGPSVECTPASCAAAVVTEAAYCDGAGTCRAPSTKSCAPYACDAGGKACRTTCATQADCSTGNTCKDGACVPGATCSPDGLTSIDKDGTKPCSPYRCRDGSCPTSCGASSDCLGGFACDASGKCVAPETTADEGGGCTYGRVASAGTAWLALALIAARRRRR